MHRPTFSQARATSGLQEIKDLKKTPSVIRFLCIAIVYSTPFYYIFLDNQLILMTTTIRDCFLKSMLIFFYQPRKRFKFQLNSPTYQGKHT